jgi:hypothetical protein
MRKQRCDCFFLLASKPEPTMATEPVKVPLWASGTMFEYDYILAMEGDGSNREEIVLNREEYIALKREIARMRNIPFSGEKTRICDSYPAS